MEKLIHKQLAGLIDDWEKLILNEWLDASESNRKEFDTIEFIWKFSKGNSATVSFDSKGAFQKLNTRISQIEPKVKKLPVYESKKNSFNFMKIAAAIALMLGVAFVIRTFSSLNDSKNTFAHGTSNSIEQIDMIDGSKILLNANSNLSFFIGEKNLRKVALSGEAYFDVAKDDSKPFVVETEQAQIKVLGTSFNVSSVEGDHTVVDLLEGVIEITNKITSETQQVKPGEQVIISGNKIEFSGKKASKEVFNNYNNAFIFQSAALSEVLSRLEFKYHKHFKWDAEAMRKCTLNGDFSEKDEAATLERLKTVFGFQEIVSTDSSIELIGGWSCD